MVSLCSAIIEMEASSAPLLAAHYRVHDELAVPEERIEALDGDSAAIFDVAVYLQAGQAMPPALDALYRLWDARRAGSAMPSRRDFAFEDLIPWLGHLMLVDAIDGGRDFVYRVF